MGWWGDADRPNGGERGANPAAAALTIYLFRICAGTMPPSLRETDHPPHK
jgi:hypothetical protein